jgi:tetrahydromethanopterin S-methyltransferase subunit A
MDDNKTVSLVQEGDILGIIQPDGIIPVGKNVVVEQVEDKKSVIEVVDNSDFTDSEYIIGNVVDCADGIDTVQPGDRVLMCPNLLYFQVDFKDKTYFVCDIDELEAVVV